MYSVLIVEDDPMVAMINEKYIRKAGGFTVAAKVANGQKALEFLRNTGVDLILLDMFMPGMSGSELLLTIRESGIDADVIMVTAANDRDTLELTRRLGVVDYLVKPFAYDRFRQALGRFAAYREALDKTEAMNQRKVDTLFGEGSVSPGTELPKGIQSETMNLILDFLHDTAVCPMTGEEIGSRIGLSGVTVRRYMNYLVSIGRAKGEMDYETGGRPCIKYTDL